MSCGFVELLSDLPIALPSRAADSWGSLWYGIIRFKIENSIPVYNIPSTSLRLMELCGGITACLEVFRMAGRAVTSYTWADIDPIAHTVDAH